MIGSGVMASYGIRDFKDIDLLVTPELYAELKSKGWQEKVVKPGFVVVENGIFEASPQMISTGNYNPDIQKIIRNADIINDVSFMTLDETINFKRALGREKDLRDIELIGNFKKLKQII